MEMITLRENSAVKSLKSIEIEAQQRMGADCRFICSSTIVEETARFECSNTDRIPRCSLTQSSERSSSPGPVVRESKGCIARARSQSSSLQPSGASRTTIVSVYSPTMRQTFQLDRALVGWLAG